MKKELLSKCGGTSKLSASHAVKIGIPGRCAGDSRRTMKTLRAGSTGAPSQFPLQQEIMCLGPFLMASRCDLQRELAGIASSRLRCEGHRGHIISHGGSFNRLAQSATQAVHVAHYEVGAMDSHSTSAAFHSPVVLLTRSGGKVPAAPRFPISSISKILSAPKKGAHPIIRRHPTIHAAESRNTYQSRAHYSISDNCTSIISGGNDLDEMRRAR